MNRWTNNSVLLTSCTLVDFLVWECGGCGLDCEDQCSLQVSNCGIDRRRYPM